MIRKTNEKLHWTVRESEFALDNRWARVRKDRCILPNGNEIPDYFYWEGGDYAQVFAITEENQVVLTHQYKHGVKEVVCELPAGMLESSDQDPLAAAQRELEEETGFHTDDWIDLGNLNVSSAKATTQAYAFLARNVRRTGRIDQDVTEDISVELVHIDELPNLFSSGIIHDTSSIAISYLAMNYLIRFDASRSVMLASLRND